MDPLLLAGIVRVALDQMREGSKIKLRTSPESEKGLARVLLPSSARPPRHRSGFGRAAQEPYLYFRSGSGHNRNQPRRTAAGNRERLLRPCARHSCGSPMNAGPLLPYFDVLQASPALRWRGRVTQIVGNLVESSGPPCSLGECCELRDSAGHVCSSEVVGFRGTTVLSMPLENPSGIRFGDAITALGARPSLAVSEELLGRVVDGLGRPLDRKPWPRSRESRPIDNQAPLALERVAIREPLACGVRAIDGFVTCGRGQRLGIFGGSGVGKSTLIGMMARGTAADLTVLALVGERGREVGEFLKPWVRRDAGVRLWWCQPPISHRCSRVEQPWPQPRSRNTSARGASMFCW